MLRTTTIWREHMVLVYAHFVFEATFMSRRTSIVAFTLDERLHLINVVTKQGAAWIEALMTAARLRYNSIMAKWVANSCLRVLDTLLGNSAMVRHLSLRNDARVP